MNKNNWTKEEDKHLRGIVLDYKKRNKTQKEALNRAAKELNRSYYACENHWRKIKNATFDDIKIDISSQSASRSIGDVANLIVKKLGALPTKQSSFDSIDVSLLLELLSRHELEKDDLLKMNQMNSIVRQIRDVIKRMDVLFQTNQSQISKEALPLVSKLLTYIVEYQTLSEQQSNNSLDQYR